MRTLWITNDLPPRSGGIEQFVHNLLIRTDPGEAVVLGPPRHDADRHDAAVPYRVVRSAGTVRPGRRTRDLARTLIREHRPDVVVLGASWPLGGMATWLRSEASAPVVSLTHGLEAGLCRVGLGPAVARATRDLAAATTISDFAEEAMGRHLRAGRVERVPPGVDPDLFHPDVDGSALRSAWGIPADAPLVGCISRLVARKGQDVLLEAWPRIAAAAPHAWLVLVGTGPREARLRNAAAALDRVVVAGEVAWDDLPAAYAALDVFAMPCRTRLLGTDVEGLGIVYLEAQAAGVPVVAGRSGGAPEAVVDGETGLVVDGREPGAVADAVIDLLRSPSRRAAAGAAGRSWIESRWSWDAIATRFGALLGSVQA